MLKWRGENFDFSSSSSRAALCISVLGQTVQECHSRHLNGFDDSLERKYVRYTSNIWYPAPEAYVGLRAGT